MFKLRASKVTLLEDSSIMSDKSSNRRQKNESLPCNHDPYDLNLPNTYTKQSSLSATKIVMKQKLPAHFKMLIRRNDKVDTYNKVTTMKKIIVDRIGADLNQHH